MSVDRQELERALDRGRMTELPPNVPPGMLGETAPDLHKVDDFKPSLNAGLLQDSSPATRQLAMILCYLLVVTSPIAAWMLWSDKNRRLRTKIIVTVVGLGLYAAVWFLMPRV